jgi:hypothetical protein
MDCLAVTGAFIGSQTSSSRFRLSSAARGTALPTRREEAISWNWCLSITASLGLPQLAASEELVGAMLECTEVFLEYPGKTLGRPQLPAPGC